MIPESWATATLGDHLKPRASRGIPADEPTFDYLGLEHVESHTGRVLGLGASEDFKSSSPLVEPGDVLYGRLRPYLNKVVIAPKKMFVSGEFIVFPPSETLQSRFLQYLLMSPNFLAFTALLDTGDRPRVSWDKIAKFDFLLPSFLEQRRIVETLDDHLSRLDKALAELDHADSQTLALRRSILNAMLNPNVSNSEPGIERMIDRQEGWFVLPLSDLTSSIANGLAHQNNPTSGGVPLSRIQTISRGEIDFDLVGYAGLGEASVAKYLLNPGDILFSHINSKEHVGKVAIYKKGMPPLVHGMNLLRIVANERVLPEYLFWSIRSDFVKNQIWGNTRHAVNQASINIRNLSTVMIPFPPLDEQRRIIEALDDQLSRLDSTRKSIASQKAWLATLRRSILNNAFIGELGNN